jgi:hypothetical protein
MYQEGHLSPDQMKHLEDKLQGVAMRSDVAIRTLKYEQAKLQLTEMLSRLDARFQRWHQKKYADKAELEELMNDSQVCI